MKTNQRFFRVIPIIFILFYAAAAFPQIEEFSIEPAGHFAGNVTCGSVQGNYAYLGQGVHLTVLDMTTDPPQQVASLEMADAMLDLAIAGDFVYLYLTNGAGLAVVNIADTEAPVQVDSVALPGGNNGTLFVSGNRLYAATGSGLYILDITAPAAPVILGSNAEAADDVAVVGNTAYCVAANSLKIYNVTGATPVALGSAPASGARGITATETHTFVAAGFLKQDVLIFDVSDPANPQQTSRFTANPPSGFANPISILVENNTAWVGCTNWLLALDVTDPANPGELSYLESVGWVVGIEKNGDDLYLFQRVSDTPYRKISAADPANPAPLATFDSPWDVKHILADENQLFIASEKRLWLYDITEQDQPRLVSSRTEWAGARRLAKDGDVLYALQGSALYMIDISAPHSMAELGTYQPVSGELREIVVQNDTAYVLVYDTPSRLEILDVSNPAAANRVGSADFSGSGVDIFKHPDNGSVFVAYNNGAADRGCTIFDCSDVENPQPAGSFSAAGDPACLWAVQDTVFIGSNDNSYILEAFDVSDASAPTKINQNTGNGLIRDMEMRGGLLFAGVEGGSVHVWGRGTIFTIYQICPSPSTIGVTVTTPTPTTTTTSSGATYSTEGNTYKSSTDQMENSGSKGVVIQKYLIVWRNMGGLVTSVAPTAEAGTAVPPTASGPIGAPVKVKAEANLGWAFTHWVNASPPNEPEAIALLGNPPTEVVAHFQPILTLSAGALNPGYTMICPAEDENDSTQTPVIQIQLTASQADDWEVSSVGFQVEGNLEAKHVRRANLHLGSEFGQLLSSTDYSTQFSFSVPPPFNKILAGSGVTFMITFDFEDKSALSTDPVTLYEDPVQFTVFTNRTMIGATAVQYPPGVVLPMIPPIPTVQGGPVFLGCVHNIDSKQVYLFLNEAIDAEATQDNHTLKVCPGEYEELVDVTKSLTIQSIKGAEVTRIVADPEVDEPAIKINKANVTMDGFTVTGAGTGSNEQAGILILQDGTVLQNMMVTRNMFGIMLDSFDAKTLHISDSEISENRDGLTMTSRRADSLIFNGNNVIINLNRSDGIEIRGSSKPFFIDGNTIDVMNNGFNGISSLEGECSIIIRATGMTIAKNVECGIFSNKELQITQPITIRENGKDGIFTHSLKAASGLHVENNGRYGIYSGRDIVAEDLWAIDNKKDGIYSDNGSIFLDGRDHRITGNGGNGIYALKRLDLKGSNYIIKDNGGWGLWAHDIRITEPVHITKNNAGGIVAYYHLKLPDNCVVDFNGGHGINVGVGDLGGSLTAKNLRSENNEGNGIRIGGKTLLQGGRFNHNALDGVEAFGDLTATDLQAEFNKQNGIIAHGKIVLHGNNIRINNNGGTGVVIRSDPSTLVDIKGGQINYNGVYGVAISKQRNDMRLVRLWGVMTKGNKLGAYYFGKGNDNNAGLSNYETDFEQKDQGLFSNRLEKNKTNSGDAGIYQCLISSNTGDGILFEGEGDLNVSRTNFINNSGFGINNQSQSARITAQDNWWGAAKGPDVGDGVSGNVDVSTWLQQPVALTASAAWDTVYTPAATSDTVLCVFQNWEAFDDVVDITISDDLEWTDITPFALAFQDSVGAATLIRYTVPDNLPLGTTNTFHITAVSQTDNSWIAADSFVVISYESSLAQVAITPDSVTLQPGQTMLFQAHGLDVHERQIPIEVTWSATGGAIDSTGLFTAGETEGTFQVTATEQSGQLTGSAVVVISLTTDIADSRQRMIPDRFALSQNYPNPFNPVTSIEYSVKEPCRVQLVVYDIQGGLVQTLVNANQSAGIYTVHFDARRLASGVYFYRILMKNFTDVKKMVVVE